MKRLIILLTALSITCFAEPKRVGQASGEAARIAKRNEVQKWLIATGAVLVAAAGLVYLSHQKGHHSE